MTCGTFVLCLVAAIAARAQMFTTLAVFDGTNGANPAYMSPVQGISGGLYGTTTQGGLSGLCEGGCGTIFEITRGGVFDSIYSFCSQANCSDGVLPAAGLLLALSGNFYGTTRNGGANLDGGTIFEISPGGNLKTLYSFCSEANCVDGNSPSGLVQAPDGNFYGTTYYGGAYSQGVASGYGTIFKVTAEGALTSLYSFCSQANCADGANPFAGLIQGTDGALYGVAAGGANCYPYGCGTVFKITTAGMLTTVVSFDGADGNGPSGPLVQGADGNLYGTTGLGGISSNCPSTNGCGTVFKLTFNGKLTTLYNFCGQPNCADGAGPNGGLVLATDGNFYGTTYGGGDIGNGTVFKITRGGKLTTLHTFCEQTGCADGAQPMGGLVQATDGNFYGTAEYGGQGPLDCCGTVFSLSTGLGPFVTFVRAAGKIGQTGGILGQGFTGTTSVLLNGTPASFAVRSDTYLTATIPTGAATGYVTVDTPGGTLTSNVPFFVIP
jgi:uncharacterized repeat protein (TIGR03803 family)